MYLVWRASPFYLAFFFSYLINSLLELGQSIDYNIPLYGQSVRAQPCSPLNSTDKLHP